MPINNTLLSGPTVTLPKKNPFRLFVEKGTLLFLSHELRTTGPDVRTYPPQSGGYVEGIYGNGFILRMADGRKIPVANSFLNLPKLDPAPTSERMPLPYE